MRKDHRPYVIKKAVLTFQKFYSAHFLKPHFAALGNFATIIKPWYVEVFGSPVSIGDHVTIVATSDHRVRLSVWSDHQVNGQIQIGNYGIICPGVRISSASKIHIGDNCMLASGVYLTDSDWHDIYNRIAFGKTEPIHIADNAWIGDSVIVCKGVSIGENSIIGAGSVVVNSIPPGCIAAGNPAKVVKHLDPQKALTTRQQWFSKSTHLYAEIDQLDRDLLRENTLRHWLRYLFFPHRGD
ncbi:MAG: acyltransferase [Desulfobacterales bacterium]|jgi:acetyltransferase-like isoleucine patch superfamily enzyme